MIQSIEDLRVEYFDGTIYRTVSYEVKDSKGEKHTVIESENVVINGFENVNPYRAPTYVIVKGISSSYTCNLTKTVAATFENTSFLLNPKEFDSGMDTPIIDPFSR